MALSPIGTRLVVSGTVFSQGSLRSTLTFYDLSDSSADEESKTTTFSYDGTLFPNMVFLSDDKLWALGDNRVCLFSYATDGKPTPSVEEEIPEEIARVMTGKSSVGLLLRQTGTDDLIFRQYNASGRRTFEKIVPGTFNQAFYSGKYAVFFNTGRVLVMTSWGRVKYQGDLDETSLWLRFTGDRTFLQFTQDKIKEFKLS